MSSKNERVTAENYALAESQVIFSEYKKKISAATKTNGLGVLMHVRKGLDPTDKTVMRANYDTLYSFALLDLTEPATIVMPPTQRYQSAWIVTEFHDNPVAFTKPGKHQLTEALTGCRFVMVIIRTQVNVQNPTDVAAANALQDKLKVEQSKRGEYCPKTQWSMSQILEMRAEYQKIVKEQGIPAGAMFGKKGSITQLNHNCGAAYGWGGLTEDQAVYLAYEPVNTQACTLTLIDVPVKAFWSITVYDEDGNIGTERYNINSAFAEANKDGSVTVHFGVDDKSITNAMDVIQGWNFTLRLYLPTEAYFQGQWKKPQLIPLD